MAPIHDYNPGYLITQAVFNTSDEVNKLQGLCCCSIIEAGNLLLCLSSSENS